MHMSANEHFPGTHAPLILREEHDGVVTLTLNQPSRFNPLSEAMLASLKSHLDAVSADPDVRVVVLAAHGAAFCAGHDLREMRAQPSQQYYKALFQQCTQVMLSVINCRVPVIARVQGLATAAGCQLVATCDLAVAADTARFAVSGVTLGLFCSNPIAVNGFRPASGVVQCRRGPPMFLIPCLQQTLACAPRGGLARDLWRTQPLASSL